MDSEKIHHTSTFSINKKIETMGISRRDFLIFVSIVPLFSISNRSEAFPLIPLLVRLFGRPLIRYGFRQFAKPQYIAKPLMRRNGSASTKMIVDKAIQANNRETDLLRAGVFLADQVWSKNGSNNSSSIIVNPSNRPLNTDDIKIQLRDEDTANVDVQAIIQPLIVPPESQLVLNMKFKNLPNEGVKRLHGTYNSNQPAEKSGRILVSKKSKDSSIEKLYEKYNRKYDGGMENIIL